MANTITQKAGTAAPAGGMIKSELAIRHRAAAHTTANSSMLYIGEDADDDGVTIRALGIGMAGDSGQGGTAIGNTMTFTGGTGITTSQAAGATTLTINVTDDSIGNTQLAYNTGQHLTSSSSPTFASLTLTGDLAVNGNDITSDSGLDIQSDENAKFQITSSGVFRFHKYSSTYSQYEDYLEISATTGDPASIAIRPKDTNGGDLQHPGLTFKNHAGQTLLDVGYTAATTVSIKGGNTTSGILRIYEDSDNGSHYSGFTVGNMTETALYTLPTADGSDGQQLTTDGSGALSWASAGSTTDTTYSTSVVDSSGIKLRLTAGGSGSGTDDVKFAGSGGTSIARTDASTITITSTDNNTEYTAGDGLTLNTLDFDLDAALTTVTSIYNANLKLGYGSSHAYADFSEDNEISFGINGVDTLILEDDYLRLVAPNDTSAYIELDADNGDDHGDRWRMYSSTDQTFLLRNNISDTYVTHFTITPNSTVANSTTAVAGHLTVGHDLTVSGDADISGTLTMGDHLYIPDMIVHSGDSNTRMRFPSTDTITFETAGTERMRVTGTEIDLTATAIDINGTADISGTLTLGTVAAAGSDVDKFLVLDGSGNVDYRTGAQTASDIGALSLSALSVTTKGTASSDGNITYNNSTGVFQYIPPTHDSLSGFVAAEHLDWTSSQASSIHSNNYTNTVDMGDGFTVAATTNTSPSTITEGDTLTIAAGTGITTTASSDGTITIANTVSDTNTNQLTTFTLTGDSGSNQTIEQGSTLDIAGGTGIDSVVGTTDTVTLSLASGAALANLSGGSGSTFLKKDGTWATPTNTTYSSSDFTHDDLTGFVANEHLDWTSDQGSTNIHSGNLDTASVSNGASTLATGDQIYDHVTSRISGLTSNAGTVTSVDDGNGLTGGAITTTGSLAVGAGDGITVNTNDVAVTPANTNLTSIINSNFTKFGRSTSQEYIDFSTSNQVNTHVNNVKVISATATDSDGHVNINGSLNIADVAAAGEDTDKFLVLDSSDNVDYRTGSQVASDIGALALSALSVGSEGTASGDGAIAYNNSSGVFTYTPPATVAALTTARALQVTLSETDSSNFNGSADVTDIGVTGTLAVGNGGTGVTTMTALKNALDDETWTFAEKITADGGIDVDNFNLNGDTLYLSSGAMKLKATSWNFNDTSSNVVKIIAPSASGDGGVAHGYSMRIRGTNSNGGGMMCLESGSANTNVTGFRAPANLSQHFIYELPDDAPAAGEVLTVASYSSPLATLEWASGGGGGSAAGSDTHIQFNDGGSSFGGSSNLTWDDTTLSVEGSGQEATFLQLKSTHSTSNATHDGPRIDISRYPSVNGADGNQLGRMRFNGKTDSQASKTFGGFMVKVVDASNGAASGKFTFQALSNQSTTDIFECGTEAAGAAQIGVWPAADSACNLGTDALHWKNFYCDNAYPDKSYADEYYGYDGSSWAQGQGGQIEEVSGTQGGQNANMILAVNNGIVTTMAILQGSDENIKTDIKDVGTGLSLIDNLKPKTFKYKDDFRTAHNLTGESYTQYGFIAQDLQTINSDYVRTITDPRDENETILAIDQKFENDLKASMIKAIQELSAKNDALEARIAALEG